MVTKVSKANSSLTGSRARQGDEHPAYTRDWVGHSLPWAVCPDNGANTSKCCCWFPVRSDISNQCQHASDGQTDKQPNCYYRRYHLLHSGGGVGPTARQWISRRSASLPQNSPLEFLSHVDWRQEIGQCSSDTIRDAILTCARKPTWVSLTYHTETTTKKCKNRKTKK